MFCFVFFLTKYPQQEGILHSTLSPPAEFLSSRKQSIFVGTNHSVLKIEKWAPKYNGSKTQTINLSCLNDKQQQSSSLISRDSIVRLETAVGVWRYSLMFSLLSLVSNSLQPHGLEPTRLLCPWDFPGMNTRVSCHFLPQGIFPTQGSSSCFLYWQAEFFFFFYHWAEREVPWRRSQRKKFNLVDSFPCIKCFRGQMCVFARFLRLYESERELIAMVCSINIIRLPSPRRTHTHCRISLKFQEAISHQDENRSDKYFLSPDKRKTISPQVYLEITS